LRYEGKAAFLVFYLKVLVNETVRYNQEEDLQLLENDFNTLVMKYRPLIAYLISKLIPGGSTYDEIKEELLQETATEIMEKADYIREHYRPGKPFRNYIWSVIDHSLLNQVKHKKIKMGPVEDLNPEKDTPAADLSSDQKLCLEDGYRYLRQIILSYNHEHPKLEVCLKTAYSLKCTCQDLLAMFEKNADDQTEEFRLICEELNKSLKAEGFTQSRRFEVIAPVLNLSDGTKTFAESYLRWTNEQIAEIILLLNQKGLCCIDRKTFAVLVEYYFMDYCCRNTPEL
jgi:DNA-directed RNA polymerase specialized sigma24 family protein